ncbi:MAG TPA: TPM domain-containing protein, partial [Longimicrobiaceae bacterium]|nr:TPM domain-containing protein [Longimicrobiaceae bacterium]
MLPARAALLALVFCLAWALPAAAQLRLPRPTGFVNDFANVIPAEQEAAIDAVVQEVRAKSGGEIVVVTLPSLQGRPASEVARQIGRDWRVGKEGRPGDPARNTGLVVLVAPRDREVRLETGLGANTFITAAETGRIQDQYMVPHFRNNDYGTGTLEGVRAIAQQYAGRFGFQLTGEAPGGVLAPDVPVQRPVSGGGGLGRILFYVIAAIIFFSLFGGGGGGGGGGRRRYGGPVIIPFPLGGGGWG